MTQRTAPISRWLGLWDSSRSLMPRPLEKARRQRLQANGQQVHVSRQSRELTNATLCGEELIDYIVSGSQKSPSQTTSNDGPGGTALTGLPPRDLSSRPKAPPRWSATNRGTHHLQAASRAPSSHVMGITGIVGIAVGGTCIVLTVIILLCRLRAWSVLNGLDRRHII